MDGQFAPSLERLERSEQPRHVALVYRRDFSLSNLYGTATAAT